jgi:hypothetical protein
MPFTAIRHERQSREVISIRWSDFVVCGEPGDMSEFLTASETHALTGFARAAEQQAWLKEHGIPHQRDGTRIVLSRFHVRRANYLGERLHLLRQKIEPYILRPDADAWAAAKYPPQGEFAGVYMLLDADGGLMYVGKSCGVGFRNVQHFWAGKRGERRLHAAYSAIEVPWEYVDGMEVAHIHALQPPDNWLPAVTWDRHDEAVKLIQEVWGPKI